VVVLAWHVHPPEVVTDDFVKEAVKTGIITHKNVTSSAEERLVICHDGEAPASRVEVKACERKNDCEKFLLDDGIIGFRRGETSCSISKRAIVLEQNGAEARRARICCNLNREAGIKYEEKFLVGELVFDGL
jgi:hypothetical protein